MSKRLSHWLCIVGLAWFVFSNLFRTFTFFSSTSSDLPGLTFLQILHGIGAALYFDLTAFLFWIAVPLSLFFLFQIILGKEVLTRPKIFLSTLLLSILWVLLWTSEFFFWEEFKAQLNFIAVDYLVYTQEIIKNIWESYPVAKILFGPFLLCLAASYGFTHWLSKIPAESKKGLRKKSALGLAALWTASGLLWISGDEVKFIKNLPIAWQEIVKNGAYSFGSAYWQNEIRYDQFYPLLSKAEESNYIDKHFTEENEIPAPTLKQKPNIVVILMESMSAHFLGAYGSDEKLTPFQDWLASNSIWFRNIYAVGTRTVRGIESLTLSVPPTPGQSIVRRPGYENLYSMGKVFGELGYDNQFLYGGRSVFDNMGPYFAANGFRIVDRSLLNEKNIRFENAWGVCDQDLFDEVLRQADSSFQKQKNFLQFVLTASNHRPYTFPSVLELDAKSGTGRESAVKYSDYALKYFIQKAQTHPWFKNTLFVFVADHNAYVAGNTTLKTDEYLIPVFFYGDAVLKKWGSKKVDSRMGSQSDILPTLLDIVGDTRKHPFFGTSLVAKNRPERAWISNYQTLGYMNSKHLALLSPPKIKKVIDIEPNPTHRIQPSFKVVSHPPLFIGSDQRLPASSLNEESKEKELILKTAISTYQYASERFREGKMRIHFAESKQPHVKIR